MAANPNFNHRIDAAENVTFLWPAPDLSVLAAGRRAPPAMPEEIFGSFWPLVCDLAEGAGAPRDYIGLGILTVAASLIGGKRRVRPYSTSNWSEPCIIWAATVGDPSSRAPRSTQQPLRCGRWRATML